MRLRQCWIRCGEKLTPASGGQPERRRPDIPGFTDADFYNLFNSGPFTPVFDFGDATYLWHLQPMYDFPGWEALHRLLLQTRGVILDRQAIPTDQYDVTEGQPDGVDEKGLPVYREVQVRRTLREIAATRTFGGM